MRILFLVYDHISPPGLLLEETKRRGAEADVLTIHHGMGHLAAPVSEVPLSHKAHDGLVVMGGPMGVHEEALYPFIGKTRALIRSFHAERKPVMGVCLGSQLIASAFGARVYKMEGPDEWGLLAQTWLPEAAEDALLCDAEPGLRLVQWHQDTFDLPEGAVHLAMRESCPHQAFRIGAGTYAFQFHLEVTPAIMQDWLRERARLLGRDPREVTAEIGPAAEALDAQARFTRRVMRRWLDLASRPRTS